MSLFTAAQEIEIVAPKINVKITLKEMSAKLPSYVVKVDDPVYKKPKEFDAFLLSDLLKLAGINTGAKEVGDELVLTSQDGYAPTVGMGVLMVHKSYLAYQNHGTPGRFELLAQGKSTISPWPFYLIWEEGKSSKEDLPWPYQLVKIEVVDFAQKCPLLVPQKSSRASAEMRGFALFKGQCLRCHSINRQGGDLGPELNIPKNVTEYWPPSTIRAFIQNPERFRLKSKMPSFDKFTPKELDELMAYLTAMKAYKAKH